MEETENEIEDLKDNELLDLGERLRNLLPTPPGWIKKLFKLQLPMYQPVGPKTRNEIIETECKLRRIQNENKPQHQKLSLKRKKIRHDLGLPNDRKKKRTMK